MLPDISRMLADIPGSLHVSILDAKGASHDGVLTSLAQSPLPSEFGYPGYGSGDTVFAALPFDLPENRLLTITDANGVVTRRRVTAWHTTPGLMICIEVGEVGNA